MTNSDPGETEDGGGVAAESQDSKASMPGSINDSCTNAPPWRSQRTSCNGGGAERTESGWQSDERLVDLGAQKRKRKGPANTDYFGRRYNPDPRVADYESPEKLFFEWSNNFDFSHKKSNN